MAIIPMKLLFRSKQHERRFFIAVKGKIFEGNIDKDYGAALYVLTSSVSTWEKAQSYITSEGIDFDALLMNVDFSHAYSALIQLAGNLFNGTIESNPIDLMGLDENNFHLAISAIYIRRFGLHTDNFQDVIESLALDAIENISNYDVET